MITENSFQRLSDPIIDIAEELSLATLNEIRKVAEKLINDPQSRINRERYENEIRRLHAKYMNDVSKWMKTALPSAYIRGIENINGQVDELGIEANPRNMQFTEGIFAPTGAGGGIDIPEDVAEKFAKYRNHLTMYEVFRAETERQLSNTLFHIIRDTDDKIRELIIEASDESYRRAEPFTRRRMTQDLMSTFAKQNITGITYADGRTMNIGSYSELVARTQTGNASRQAQINRLQELGHSLVRMSVHWPSSPMCEDWQGGVYDSAGISEQYPSLDTAIAGGAFHVNCKHSLRGYFPGISPAMQERDKFGKKENERRYNLTQEQRYNERQIRYWKRRKTTAITDAERQKAKEKISQWQAKNRTLVEKNDFLRRKYDREQI